MTELKVEFKDDFPWKKNEGNLVNELREYLRGTYGEHYATNDGIQTIDVWESLGSLETTARDSALKYLMRYGKKDGKNRKDLLKTLHYVILMIYLLDKEEKK